MKVFIKYIFKNMTEKKGRFVLLILSIALSTALLVACTGLVDVIKDGFTSQLTEMSEGQDIYVVNNSDNPYFTEQDIDTSNLENIVGRLETVGVISENEKIRYVSISGRKSYDKSIIEGEMNYEDNSASCMISKRIADERDINIGDILSININGEEKGFEVASIAANEGTFYGDTNNSFNIIVPYEYLNEEMDAHDSYNVMTAQVKSGSVKKFVKQFNNANEFFEASNIGDISFIGVGTLNVSLYGMLSIVVLVSSIIIYGVFKLIINERLSVIGTFMSQGATKKKIERIILSESLMYSIIAGIVGSAIGELILFGIGRMVSPLAKYKIYLPFNVNYVHVIIGINFAIILSILSAYMPVRAVRKLEVKDVILNRVESINKKGKVKFIIGLIIFVASIVLYEVDKKPSVLSVIEMIGIIVGLIMIVPTIVKLVSSLFCKIFKNNTNVYLAMNNVRTSKLLRNNIVLIIISLTSVFLVSSVGETMKDVVNDAYEEMRYDYKIQSIMASNDRISTTDRIIEKLNSIDGVDKDSICPELRTYGEIKGQTILVMGVEPKTYADMNLYLKLKEKKYKDDYEEFANAEDNAVVITEVKAKEFNKKKGDMIDIVVNSKTYTFRVAAIIDGGLYNNSTFCIIKKSDMIREMHIKEADEITFKVNGDSEQVMDEVRPYLLSIGAQYSTRAEDTQQNIENNEMMSKVISAFSYLAMFVASIGVLNNIVICFNQRKKEFAVLASVGMNVGKRRNLILTESFICVLWSIIIAIPFTLFVNLLVSNSLKYSGLLFDIAFSWTSVPVFSTLIVAIILLASLSTVRKSKKLSVVGELKYE